MMRYNKRRLFLTTVAMTAIFSFALLLPKDVYIMNDDFLNADAGLLVNTPGCKIPNIDPYDRTMRHLLYKGTPIKCNASRPITYVDKTWLRFNMTILMDDYGQGLDHCEYQTVIRGGDGKTDNLFMYEEEPTSITEDTPIVSEFIRIACFGKNGDMIYANFHAFIQDKSNMDARASSEYDTFLRREKPTETLNILMIGVDSMSRLNFIRQMPKTRAFLLNKMDAVEMSGYNKVADNTFVNLVPMFGGKYVEELPWTEMMSDEPFDKYDFLWNEFTRHGYRTLWAEDAPEMAIFNYNKAGFQVQPTDYYLRPLSLAMENHRSIWRNDHHCVGAKLETEIVLDWTHEFLDRFKTKPHFSFSFITRLTHDDINRAGAADEPHFQFLTSLYEKQLLNNTVVIYFSDHGIRFGQFREGYVGKMEERLPAMLVAFPKWFQEKYPDLIKNVQMNGHRLTTPFDIYETLKDLSNFQVNNIRQRKTSLQRGISLFDEIPTTRTCEQASILTHWCTCHSQKMLEPTTPNVVKAADALLQHINKELDVHNMGEMCEILSLHKVETATEIIANNDVLHFKRSLGDVLGRKVTFGDRTKPLIDYQLTIRTIPGDALFEATVRHSEEDNSFKIIGDVSRINRYGDQSSCIDNFNMKKYCNCRQ